MKDLDNRSLFGAWIQIKQDLDLGKINADLKNLSYAVMIDEYW